MTDTKAFMDVLVREKPFPALVYRTGLTVYEEALMQGRFVGRGWNGAGEQHFENMLLDPNSHPTPQAFWLEVDGHLLASHWAWEGVAQEQTARGLQVTVSLRHTVRPVKVRVHTLLDGTPILARRLEITHIGDRPAALSAACPWSGVLHSGAGYGRPFETPADGQLYSLGYMINFRWGGEGSFEWRPLPNAAYRIDGRYRRDRWRHPLYVLRFKGLDFGKRYRVTSDNRGSAAVMEGRDLMGAGLPIRLDGPLTSELLLCEACGG